MENSYVSGRRIKVIEVVERDDIEIEATALAIGGSVSNKGEATIIFERNDGTIGERPIVVCKFVERYTKDDWVRDYAEKLWNSPGPAFASASISAKDLDKILGVSRDDK